MLPLTVLALAGLAPTTDTDTVMETLPDGSISITNRPHQDGVVAPAPASDAPEYSLLRWGALVGLVPSLTIDLVPARAVPQVPSLAQAAREWLLQRPLSAELRRDVLRAPLDLDLIAAAVGRARADNTEPALLAALRAESERLGLHGQAAAAAPVVLTAATLCSTLTPAQALAVTRLRSASAALETLAAAIQDGDPGRIGAARPPLEHVCDNAIRCVRALEQHPGALAESPEPQGGDVV